MFYAFDYHAWLVLGAVIDGTDTVYKGRAALTYEYISLRVHRARSSESDQSKIRYRYSAKSLHSLLGLPLTDSLVTRLSAGGQK